MTFPARASFGSFLCRGALALALATVAACGGGGGRGDDAPPAAGNTVPLAAFSAPDSVVAGSAARFDAAASSDADGDALTYSWEFNGSGPARRGGGMQIAQAFATPGTYTVKLTVADGRGGIASATRSVDVTLGAASTGTVETLIIVRDRSGTPLDAVSVGNADSGAVATTAADGRATVATPRGIVSVLRLSKAGYADQVRTLVLPAGAESGYLEATMAPREAALTLADAAAGGTLSGKDGASVVFAAGSIVDAAGAPVSGPVQVTMTPIDVGADVHSFPGRFEGLRRDGTSTLILSYGTVEFSLAANGQPVQLAPGRTAIIEVPSYAGKHVDGSLVKAGDATPLWSLDETSGAWVEEGSGVIVPSANSPSGFALRAEVTHFSWWNADAFLAPPHGPAALPKPKCMVDSNADGVLEDLTGTGYCWNAGTGPEQPESIFAASTGRRHALAGAGSMARIPAWAADAWIPAAGGVALPMPAALDVTLRAYAKNGTLFGTKVVNLASGAQDEVPILLEPVADNPGTLAVALPYDERFVLHAAGESDRFTFLGEAGANYEIQVGTNASSQLTGRARVLGANGAQLAEGAFDGGFGATVSAGSGGTMTVVVTAVTQAPGGYRVTIRKVVASSCSSAQAIVVPQTLPSVAIAAGATLCFDLPLQAGDAIDVRAILSGQPSGVLTLLAPDGTAALSHGYGFGVGPFRFETGVAASGTWRLQVSNSSGNAGTLQAFAFSRVALAGTIDLGASASHTGAIAPAGLKYLVRPGAATAVAYKLAVTGAAHNADVAPMNAFIDAPVTTGRVLVHPGSLLPVVTVFTTSTSSGFTLSTAAAEAIALDTDVTAPSPEGGDVRVWRVDGAMGAQWSAGFASTLTGLQLSLYGPDGARLNGTGASHLIHELPASGAHTLELRRLASGSAPMTVRVNTAAPPEPLVLGALTQRNMTLAIGEVRRYTFDVTRGQLLGLRLSTTSGVRGQAQIDGGSIHNAAVVLAPPSVLTRHSGPLFVRQSEAAVLSVYSTGHAPTDVAGALAVEIEAPTPTPAALGQLLSLQLPPSTLVDWRYDIATAGKHLLCWSYVGAVDSGDHTRVRASVWGPVAPFSDTDGDLGGGGQGNVLEALGNLAAGQNTLTLFSNLPAAVPATARLVPVAPATTLAAGAADSGSIAACQRRYYTFAAVVDQAFTVKVTAGFSGSVRVRKLPPNGDVTARADPPFSTNNLGGTPLPLAAGVERAVAFTIPSDSLHGSGTYVVEIDADGDEAGTYTVGLSSP